jgi:zinc protease
MIRKYIFTAALFALFYGDLMASALPKYESITLDNGLEVVAIPLKNNSVITTEIFYKVGSRDEVMGKSGIAHMLEHMNFKSTKKMKAGEFDEIVKGFGGMNNASTGFDYTHYYINSSKEHLGKTLELFADMMENLDLKDKEFQPERKVVAEERLWRTDNTPSGYMYFNLFNLAFSYHPYHWMPIGFMDDIQNWGIEDIRSFHKKYYTPNNAMVIVAGDVEPKALFEEAKKQFGAIKKGPELTKPYAVEPEQKGEKRAILYKDTGVEMLAIAYKIPSYEHADMTALAAVSELLGSGKSSRLQKALIDKKRLVNSIYTYPMDLKDPSIFIIMATCNEGVKAETVEVEVLAEIEKIKHSIDKKEIEKLKVNTKADFIFSLESSSHVADLYGSYLARGNIKPLFEYEGNIEKLSADDIKKAASLYLGADAKTTVILRKKEK